MLLDLQAGLTEREIVLRLVEARASVRNLLRLEGADERVGTINRYAMLADVIETSRRRKLDDDPAVAVRQPPMRVNISD